MVDKFGAVRFAREREAVARKGFRSTCGDERLIDDYEYYDAYDDYDDYDDDNYDDYD